MIQGGNKNYFGRYDKINNWYEIEYIKLWGMYNTSDCSIAARASRQTSVYFYPLFYKAQTGLMPQNTNNYIASIPQSNLLVTKWELPSIPALGMAPKHTQITRNFSTTVRGLWNPATGQCWHFMDMDCQASYSCLTSTSYFLTAVTTSHR